MATKRGKVARDADKRAQKKAEEEEIPPPVVETKPEEPPEKVEPVPIDVEESVVEETPQVEEPHQEIIYEEPILTQIIVEKFEGERVKGLYDGEGEIFFTGGHHYKGQFLEGLMHGKGTYTWSDGIIYTGDFFRNQVTGQGVYNWKDGSSYEGEVLNGLRHGVGVMHYGIGMIYSGQWVNGKQSGKGKLDYDSLGKSFYDGDWCDNIRHGVGTRCYPSGNIYRGTWYHNVRHGEGTMHWYDQNQSYSGQWEDGIQHGIGEWIWYLKRGAASQYTMHNTYRGQIYRCIRHGFGIFHYANGARYEGEWKNNVKCGKGKFVFKNGRIYEGEFEDDHILEYPQFEMDGRITPDISQIRTRTPLPSERASVHSNASINTLSPSFQLDVDYLLKDFEETDREEEASQVVFAMLRHMTGIHRIYSFYSRLGLEASKDNTHLMTQMQFWRFLKDCKFHHLDCGLVDMDRWLANDPVRFKEMHDPNRKVLFREFLNHIVVLAFHLYHSKYSGYRGILASCLSHLMTENVLKNACIVKGHFYHKLERASNALAHVEEVHEVYKALCISHQHPPDRTITMRQFLLLMKKMNLISTELTPKAIVDILASDDPKVIDPQGAINLELEMGFLDFFEALVGCAEVYVTEAMLRDPSISSHLVDMQTSIETQSQQKTELQNLKEEGLELEDKGRKNNNSVISLAKVQSPPPLVPVSGLDLAASSVDIQGNQPIGNGALEAEKAYEVSKVDEVLDNATSTGTKLPQKAEEMENLVAACPYVNYQSHGHADADYKTVSSMMIISEETRQFNFWTHQVHIFFIRKFLPVCRHLLEVRRLTSAQGQLRTSPNVDGC